MSEEISAESTVDEKRAALPWPVLSIDVETNPANNNQIFLIG